MESYPVMLESVVCKPPPLLLLLLDEVWLELANKNGWMD
jgi:hypothetical protein